MKELISHSVEETNKIASDWLVKISAQKNSNGSGDDEATVVALNGHLGSGKTTFTQAVARALGIKENITSPTFVIMKMYDVVAAQGEGRKAYSNNGRGGFKRLVHIDAYRLEHDEDLDALNFEEIVADPGNLVLIEWAENVRGGLPENFAKIDFEYVGENERSITLK